MRKRIAERPLAEYHPQVGALWRSRHEEPESEEFISLPDWMQGPLERPERRDLEVVAAYLLTTLTRREATLLFHRYWKDLTLEECGKRMGVTQERIRQIEMKALRKMRHPSRSGFFSMATDVPSEIIGGYDCLPYLKAKGCLQEFIDWKKESPHKKIGY